MLAVVKTQVNVHVMQRLLKDVDVALTEGMYHHVGSAALWSKHTATVERMQNNLNSIHIKEVGDGWTTTPAGPHCSDPSA